MLQSLVFDVSLNQITRGMCNVSREAGDVGRSFWKCIFSAGYLTNGAKTLHDGYLEEILKYVYSRFIEIQFAKKTTKLTN